MLVWVGDVVVSDPHGISVASQGWLIFSGEALAEAVGQVNRFGGLRFEIADARIAQKRIGGPVCILEPDNFVLLLRAHHITSKAVGQSPDLSSQISAERIEHAPAGRNDVIALVG